jgi:hypothetical protein
MISEKAIGKPFGEKMARFLKGTQKSDSIIYDFFWDFRKKRERG